MAEANIRRIRHIMEEVQKMVNDNEEVKATALNDLKETQGGDPFLILIGTILSQRTRDPGTVKATRRLFARYHNAAELASADESKVRDLIKPVTYPTLLSITQAVT